MLTQTGEKVLGEKAMRNKAKAAVYFPHAIRKDRLFINFHDAFLLKLN
jgi:hypothetical protein